MSPVTDSTRKTRGSQLGEDKHRNVERKTSGSLVGMAVQNHEIKEKHQVQRAETPNTPERLHAEPEVVLLHQRQKLRPRSENLSDFRKQDQLTNGQNELQSARQLLRKVRRMSNGSEVSSSSGPETNGHDYGAFAKVNGWNGMTNGGHHNGYISPPSAPSSTTDEQTVIVNIDSESEIDDTYDFVDFNPSQVRGVNIQPSSRYNHFNISNNNRGYHPINSPDDGESTSVSSSSYYADIDDVANEMLELSKKIEDHRL